MDDLDKIEAYFKNYSQDLPRSNPEGIIDIDLTVLRELGLLGYHIPSNYDTSLTRYFHVIETKEKITLVNEQFVVWIIPEKMGEISITYVMIALNRGEILKLELIFSASGVYNNSKLVLRVLEKYLAEIQENEEFMKSLKS